MNAVREHSKSIVLFVSLSGWQAGPGRNLSTLLAYLPPEINVALASPTIGDLLPAVRQRSRFLTHVSLPRHGQHPDIRTRILAMAILAKWMMQHRRSLLAVHANGFSELHVSALGVILARIPLVVWFQGHEQNPWDARLGPVWSRLVRRRQLVAVSEIAQRRASAAKVAKPDEISIIPCPIDPIDVVAARSSKTTDLTETIVVGYFGGTLHHKGFSLLPKVIEGVRNINVTWALFCSPSPTDDPAIESTWRLLKQMDGGVVSILGRMDDVREAFGLCDIMLSLSSDESFGRAIAEAMMNGIPVVASDIEAHRALLGANQAGILFPLGDSKAAALAIRELAVDAEIRRLMGESGRLRAMEFGPEAVASQFAALYDSC